MLVSGVITQGARHTPDWVTEYRVSYSLDGQRWDYYKENGTAKVISFFHLRSMVNSYVIYAFNYNLSTKYHIWSPEFFAK